MKRRRRHGWLPVILNALGQPETSTAVGELVDAFELPPVEIWEKTAGAPVRQVRRLLFDSGGEIVLHNDAVAAVLLHLLPTGNATRGVHLAHWIAGSRNDASLDDLAKALRSPARTAPEAMPYFSVDGGYLQPTFKPGHPWRKKGGLLRVTITPTNPGRTALPKDDDCPTCRRLLVRNDDFRGGVDVDATIRELTSNQAVGLLTEDATRVRLADLRPLYDSGLMERVESQLTCKSCKRIICFTLARDSAPTFDYYTWSAAVMRPRDPIPPVEQWGDAARIVQAEDELHYVDHARSGWFLLSRRADLYLDARYSYSGIIDDSVLIRLDESECEAYRTGGRDYLSDLAMRMHNSSPFQEKSPYYARDLYRGPDGTRYRREVSAAVADHTWMAERRRNAADRQR
ncbi:hypothetical protein [Ruania zhangjianzhongii]|uniref:hypothetical protein n=1 Tax=Ruania zhangjianzhongii TaxID=2603206 RepID=UPI0011C7D097|nr:hypothetical protein [Ruania zhangjianzhongii]